MKISKQIFSAIFDGRATLRNAQRDDKTNSTSARIDIEALVISVDRAGNATIELIHRGVQVATVAQYVDFAGGGRLILSSGEGFVMSQKITVSS